jgi:hypothetical protein
MEHSEMLKKLGLTKEQFHDLVRKHAAFVNSLDDHQRAVVRSSSPSVAEAAASFGPDAKPEDLQRLLDEAKPPDAAKGGVLTVGFTAPHSK